MKFALVIIALLVAFGIAGTGDFDEAQAQHAVYCDRVASGVWGDYAGHYAEGRCHG